jgi:hypothetical protein
MPGGSAGEIMTKKLLSRMRDQRNDLVTKAQSSGGRATTLVTPMSNPGYCATSVGPMVRTDNCAPSDSPASPPHEVPGRLLTTTAAHCTNRVVWAPHCALPARTEAPVPGRQLSAFGAGVSPPLNVLQAMQNKGLAHRAAERVRRRRCAQTPQK